MHGRLFSFTVCIDDNYNVNNHHKWNEKIIVINGLKLYPSLPDGILYIYYTIKIYSWNKQFR